MNSNINEELPPPDKATATCSWWDTPPLPFRMDFILEDKRASKQGKHVV
jgi:hypothetical protein